MRAWVLLVAVSVSCAVLAVSASARVKRTAAEPWSGTLTVVTEVAGILSYPAGSTTASTDYRRHDEATYTLTGADPTGDAYPANMSGSGTGSAPTTLANGACATTTDPVWKWSYQGPANVLIAYANGSFTIAPQNVPVTAESHVFGCGVDNLLPVALNAPPAGGGSSQTTMALPVASQTAGADVTQLSSSASFPWQFVLGTGPVDIGTITLTWNLTRGGAATPPPAPGSPPTGTASGTVLVNGQLYTSGQPIPYGSKVGVTHGRLTLNTEVGPLTVFGGGVSAIFKLLRFTEKGKGLVELRLVEGDFSVCKRSFRTAQAAQPSKKTVRRLYANGKGRFRTRGRYSAAAVRGTNWLTADRCDGTLTQVKQGKVAVTDLVKHKTVLVPAGKSYLARPK